MQESYGEDPASHTDPESWTVARKGGCEALIVERFASSFSLGLNSRHREAVEAQAKGDPYGLRHGA